MDALNWAQKEIELAIESEKKASEGTNDWEYGVACYESAMRAYKALLDDNHSGMSIHITKSILNRLIDGRCLTPIEDTPDIWSEEPIFLAKDGAREYQCKRMSSLFKKVAPDGTVTYSDINRVSCIDISNTAVPYHNGFATRLVEAIFPIEMPYLAPSKPFRMFTEELLFGDKGDYDTVAYLYILMPDGHKIELNRYFKEDTNGQLVPIDKEEWDHIKAAVKERSKKDG